MKMIKLLFLKEELMDSYGFLIFILQKVIVVTRLDVISLGSKIFNIKIIHLIKKIIIYLRYQIVLDSDAEEFGGHRRLNHSTEFFTSTEQWDNRNNSLKVNFIFNRIILFK